MRFFPLLLSLLCLSSPAFAYIGPGAGLGAIGVLVAIVGGVLLLIVGFVWYPLKRMMRNRKNATEPDNPTED